MLDGQGYRPGVGNPRYREVDYYKLTDKGIELRNASAATKMPRLRILDSKPRTLWPSERPAGVGWSGEYQRLDL